MIEHFELELEIMNMRNYLARLLCLSLCLAFLAPTAVFAGADRQLVEVDAEESARLEKERVAMQEAYEKEAKKVVEEDEDDGLEERMRKAQELRDKEIDERNQHFVVSQGEDDGSVAECPPRKCFFFCWLWKIIIFPFKLLAMPFTS